MNYLRRGGSGFPGILPQKRHLAFKGDWAREVAREGLGALATAARSPSTQGSKCVPLSGDFCET